MAIRPDNGVQVPISLQAERTLRREAWRLGIKTRQSGILRGNLTGYLEHLADLIQTGVSRTDDSYEALVWHDLRRLGEALFRLGHDAETVEKALLYENDHWYSKGLRDDQVKQVVEGVRATKEGEHRWMRGRS